MDKLSLVLVDCQWQRTAIESKWNLVWLWLAINRHVSQKPMRLQTAAECLRYQVVTVSGPWVPVLWACITSFYDVWFRQHLLLHYTAHWNTAYPLLSIGLFPQNPHDRTRFFAWFAQPFCVIEVACSMVFQNVLYWVYAHLLCFLCGRRPCCYSFEVCCYGVTLLPETASVHHRWYEWWLRVQFSVDVALNKLKLLLIKWNKWNELIAYFTQKNWL